jgi:cell division septation protein DedD
VKVTAPEAVQKEGSPVLPPVAQQPKEQPGTEVKPDETKEALQTAPQQALPQAPQQSPEQPQQKAPAVVPAAKSGVEPFYSVQLGAFKSEAGAETLAKVYKGKGHEAFTHKATTTDNMTLYRVLIGKFKNKKEASQLADKLQAKEKIKTTIFSEGMK